jgi:hypothetical protein
MVEIQRCSGGTEETPKQILVEAATPWADIRRQVSRIFSKTT